MRLKFVIVLAVAMVSGCAQRPKEPDMPLSKVAPTPVCMGEEQCSAMWGRAISAAQMVTRMKVMNASDTFIQTFPTREIGHLNGQVFKQSLGGGKYAIKGSFNCSPYSWCSNLINGSLNSFNLQVQGY